MEQIYINLIFAIGGIYGYGLYFYIKYKLDKLEKEIKK